MSKLNPQKASAYVGKGVLKGGGNITPVPNGPLIKKTGKFKGSTLRAGGVVKKAQAGVKLTPQQKRAQMDSIASIKRADIVRKKDSILNRNATARGMTRAEVQAQQQKDKNKPDAVKEDLTNCTKRTDKKGSCTTGETGGGQSTKDNKRNGGIMKKAQFGKLVKKVVKKTTKEIIPVAEKNLTRVDAPYNKKGLKMAIERRVNPEVAKKKMTAAQRRSFEVDDSYRRNGGPIEKAQGGKLLRKVADKIVSKGSNRIVDRIVKRPVGMTDKPVNYGKVILTDAQKAKNAEILKNPGTATAESWKKARKIAKKESSAQSNAQYLERSNKPMITRPDSPKISTLARTAKSIKKNKAGGMIKRADGSMSKRGLWDNIRANKGSGKKPTKQMLVQEKKIKAKSKK